MERLTKDAIDRMASDTGSGKEYIKVGMSSCGIAAGAEEVFAVLVDEAKKRNIQIEIQKCGCLGMCFAEPLVEVKVDGLPPVMYGKVNKDIALKIMEKHVVSKLLVNDCIFDFKAQKQ